MAVLVRGVVFRRSIRSSYATLDLVVRDCDDEESQHVIVTVQFSSCIRDQDKDQDGHDKSGAVPSSTQIRSYLRRSFKLGDEVEVKGDRWSTEQATDEATEKRGRPKKLELIGFVPPRPTGSGTSMCSNTSSANTITNTGIKLIRRLVWDNIQCQEARARFYPAPAVSADDNNAEKNVTTKRKRRKSDDDEAKAKAMRHGGGIGKRKQGEIIANFLIDKVSAKVGGSLDEAITYLNSGSGVIDPAGGSGHVSLGLALRGVRSTVVDPRPTVGRLPKRDRKALRMAIRRRKNEEADSTVTAPISELQMHPPIQFSSLRAWFASKPAGVDTPYREGTRVIDEDDKQRAQEDNESNVPICHMCSPDRLLPTCSGIVALHPDEATGCIVDFAVKHRIPFVVVPCCVFSRMFPNRFKKTSGEIVSTYDDLVDWLVAKDPSIRVETLPFDGANKAVWSMFVSAGSNR